jgi:endonuclease/exonuclease/phosphatase (EEP) superfamily protein YafD
MTGLVIASFNTRGMPMKGSDLMARYAAIGAVFEASNADVVAAQEVHTYVHLRQLKRGMPSFGSITYRSGPVGPAGGLVTLARRPAHTQRYQRFPLPDPAPGLPQRARWMSPAKGMLVTRLTDPDVSIVNTHPTANADGDWSSGNRFTSLHRQQLASLAAVVQSLQPPVVVCGDFNIARDSDLHRDFLEKTQLADAFGGQCAPTFRSGYLPDGRTAHCIDFILVSPAVATKDTHLMFTAPMPLRSGTESFLSDHLGLCATLW